MCDCGIFRFYQQFLMYMYQSGIDITGNFIRFNILAIYLEGNFLPTSHFVNHYCVCLTCEILNTIILVNKTGQGALLFA